ncbi:tRNA (adenosine(37)-N6)-dimethylallyltransferase MiaA [Nibricoccus sp. IMCC34717]|uniref:tRNA (adenosine(37)-N6)-dimethylallyltransferase MiaA n=1 Tax=Nibricoccus sp. IMCC34717 TaxID=3034021 RepID=UPI0038506FD9
MKIAVLTGPTAVGKTERALCWAEERGGEILSCDSLLFYRGMDIGTAKPTRAELGRVRHHLIDVCEPWEPMDVGRFVQAAKAVVADCEARGVPLLVTGGSGFYLQCFFGPVTDAVEVPPEVRARVRELEQRAGLAGLIEALRPLCPEGFGDLALANPRRVTRALERCLASGRSYSALKAEFEATPGPFAEHEVELTVLDRPPAELDERIRLRVEAMLAAGLVDEVRRLRAIGFERNSSACGAIGYREVLAMLEGKLAAEALAPEIIRNTRALVKKQRTWFRRLNRS